MSFFFNADEIFQMAERIEKDGAKFYRKSAESLKDPSVKDLLYELASMEDNHFETFASMKSALSEKEKKSSTFDPNSEASLYLSSLADTRVFFKKEMDTSTLEGILKAAITAEKDSIVFYLGMKDLVSDSLGKDKIDSIIKEEMGHIKLLSNKLSGLKKQA